MRGFVLAAAMILVSAGAHADESRNLSLGGSEPVSAVDTVWAPMPRGEEAKSTKSIDRPKFTGCPPDVEMSRRSRIKAAASQQRAPRHQELIAHGEAQTFDDVNAAAERALDKL